MARIITTGRAPAGTPSESGGRTKFWPVPVRLGSRAVWTASLCHTVVLAALVAGGAGCRGAGQWASNFWNSQSGGPLGRLSRATAPSRPRGREIPGESRRAAHLDTAQINDVQMALARSLER